MKHHYLEPAQITGNLIKITGPKYHHLKNVLRVRCGEKIKFFDKDFEYLAEIQQINEREITAKILKKSAIIQPEKKVYLAQGLAKAQKIDLVIQKISEIGVDGLIPFVAKNSDVKIKEEKIASKMGRWEEIAIGAAEQSGRSLLLEISAPVEWPKLLKKFSEFDLVLIFWEKAKAGLKVVLKNELSKVKGNILLVVGPEGSFSEEEIGGLGNLKNVRLATLGKNILRTETAGIVACSLVLYELGMLVL